MTAYERAQEQSADALQRNKQALGYGQTISPFQGQNYATQIAGARGAQAESRGQQMSLAQALAARARGEGSSLAEQQLQRTTQSQAAQIAAQLGAQRGVSPAMAARQAAMSGAAMQQQAAGQGAMLRSQEQQQAQAILSQHLAGQRQQDLGMYAAGVQGLGQQNALGVQAYQAAMADQAARDRAAIDAETTREQAWFKLWGDIAGGLTQGAGAAGMGLALGAWDGGEIPGRALRAGDHPDNDTVPALLSPGEVVLPRSVAQHPNAPQKAKSFVEALRDRELAKDSAQTSSLPPGLAAALRKHVESYAEGGVVPLSEAEPLHAPPLRFPLTSQVGEPMPDEFVDYGGRSEAQVPEWLKAGGVEPERLNDSTTPLPPPSPAGGAGNAATMPSGSQPDDVVDIPSQTAPVPSNDNDSAAPGPEPAYEEPDWVADEAPWVADTARALDALAAAHRTPDGEEPEAVTEARQRHQEQVSAFQEAFQGAQERYKAMRDASELQPNRLWADMSAGQKTLAVISLLMSGVGSGILKQPNAALNMLEGAIERDVAAQQSEREDADNLYQAHLQWLGHAHAAALMTKADMADAIAAWTEQKLATRQDSVNAANLQLDMAKLRQSAQQDRERAAQQTLENNLAHARLGLQRQGQAQQQRQWEADHDLRERQAWQQQLAAGEAGAREEQVRSLEESIIEGGPQALNTRQLQALYASPLKEQVLRLPDGRITLAASPKEAVELREGFETFEDVMQRMERYREIIDQHPSGWSGMDKGWRKRAVTLFEGLAVKLARMNEKGVLTDADLERYKNMIPDANDYSVKNWKYEQLDELTRGLTASANAALNSKTLGPPGSTFFGSQNKTPEPVAPPEGVEEGGFWE